MEKVTELEERYATELKNIAIAAKKSAADLEVIGYLDATTLQLKNTILEKEQQIARLQAEQLDSDLQKTAATSQDLLAKHDLELHEVKKQRKVLVIEMKKLQKEMKEVNVQRLIWKLPFHCNRS